MHYLNLRGTEGKTFIFSFVIVLFFAFTASAQVPMQEQEQQQQELNTDFSDQELEQFVAVFKKANEIQQKNEEVMIQAIEGEDLELERFNEILVSRQQQQSAEDIGASAEEMAAFNQAAEKIMSVQQEAQAEIQQVIEDELGMEKYQQIVIAYQQDPEVQEKVNQMLESEMQETEPQETETQETEMQE